MSSVVMQAQIMDTHSSTKQHRSVRNTLVGQDCNLGMGQFLLTSVLVVAAARQCCQQQFFFQRKKPLLKKES
jgi:hypothetical protein